MKKVYIIAGIIIVVIMVYSFSSTQTQKKPKKDYVTRIMEMRLKKEQYFRTASDSPFKDKNKIRDLKYFTPDKNYRVTAKLEINKDPETMEMGTSKGTQEIYYKYGYANFTLNDKKLKLLVLKKNLSDKMLFIAFRDQTSGKETYGAGRYMDIAQTKPNEITLDFNQAYSPYCAYNEAFVCPMPPLENQLAVAIKAGEKNFK